MPSSKPERFVPTCCELERRETPAAGNLLANFGSSGLATYDLVGSPTLYDAVRTPNGQFLLAGITQFQGQQIGAVLRVNSDGTRDTSFVGGGGLPYAPNGHAANLINIASLPDGRFVIAVSEFIRVGLTGAFQGTNVARFNADGSLDTTFGGGTGSASFNLVPTNGNGLTESTEVLPLPDGRMILSSVEDNRRVVVRLTADGTLDPTFAGGSFDVNSLNFAQSNAVATGVQNNASVLLSGLRADGKLEIVRLTPQGGLDPSFDGDGRQQFTNPLSGAADPSTGPTDLLEDASGRIYLVANLSTAAGTTNVLGRLLPTGTIDASFGGGLVSFRPDPTNTAPWYNNSSSALADAGQGRMLVLGAVSDGSGRRIALLQFREDGTLDPNFGTAGRGQYSFPNVLATVPIVEPSGRILIAAIQTGNPSKYALIGVEGSGPTGLVGGGSTSSRRLLPDVYAAGTDAGSAPLAAYFNPDGSEKFRATPFDASVTGGVRTAVGDINGDGVYDLIVGTGPGSATLVRIIDGATQAELFRIAPFEAAFTGGVFVAAGDLNGDGYDDFAISPDEGGGPRIRVFDGKTRTQIVDFFGIEDPNFRGGVRISIGDVNGDGFWDLAVAAGFGGGPRIALFYGQRLAEAAAGGLPPKIVPDFFIFETALRNGAYIALGDIDGDTFSEVIGGGGPGGGPRVYALDGKSLLTTNNLQPVSNFIAGDAASRGGIRVVAKDIDRDGKAELVTGTGTNGGNHVSLYSSASLLSSNPKPLRELDPFGAFAGGVFVG